MSENKLDLRGAAEARPNGRRAIARARAGPAKGGNSRERNKPEAKPRQGQTAAAPYGARPRRPAERNSREQKELAQPQRFLNQFQPVQNALGLVAGLVVLGVGDVFFGVLDFLRQRGLVEIG